MEQPAAGEQTGADAVAGRRGVSASRAIVVLLVVLALAAVLVPLPMHRPVWVEAEAVLAAWWLVWAAVLSSMLYAGIGVRNDWSPRTRQSNEHREGIAHFLSNLDLPDFDLGGSSEMDGCVSAIVAIALVGLLILGVWILLEVVFPLVIPLGYGLMLLLLSRVVHRHESCRGQPLRAMAFGMGWASVYTLPLVLGVALVHLLA
jgi:hypothetical protein